MDLPALHPDLDPLEFLSGTWTGTGQGSYPTIDSFVWTERTTFTHVGKPVLVYEQRTRDALTGEPRHAESGFLRPGPTPGRVELVVAHPSGHTEVAEGVLDGTRIELTSTSVGATASAKPVTTIARVLHLAGDVLRMSLAMEAVGQPLTHHLAAELTRDA